jgi:hypothetical protein
MTERSEEEYDRFAEDLARRVVGAMHASTSEDGVFVWFRPGATVFVRPDGSVFVNAFADAHDVGALAFPLQASSSVRELRDILLAVSKSGLDEVVVNASMTKVIEERALDTAVKTGIWIGDAFFDSLRRHSQLQIFDSDPQT